MDADNEVDELVRMLALYGGTELTMVSVEDFSRWSDRELPKTDPTAP